MRKKDFLLVLLIFSVPLVDALWHNYVVDDAFISFRYARNLSRGMGLVFNPDERVEGYTNFLWILLLTPAFWLKIDPLFFSRIFSTASGFATLFLLVRFQSNRKRFQNNIIYIAPLLCAFNASFSVWLLSGMETHLFTFLLTWGILSFLDRRVGEGDKWSLLLVLASLTRPEGLLFLAIAWVISISERVAKRESIFGKETLKEVLPFIALYLPYLGWKMSYYGALLPNTFHAKVGSSASQVWRGLVYVKSFVEMSGGVVFGLPLLLAISHHGRRLLRVSLPFLLPYVVYVILVGGDSMVKFRFLLPILPTAYLLVGESIGWTGSLVKNLKRSSLLVITLSISSVFLTVDLNRSLVEKRREMVSDWIDTGKWLAANYNPDTVIAYGAIGALPYYSDLYTIDIFGLTDPHIARREVTGMGKGLPGHEKADGAYVLFREPDIILPKVILTDKPPDENRLGILFSGSRAEREIWMHPSFRKRYSPVVVKLKRGYLTFFSRGE